MPPRSCAAKEMSQKGWAGMAQPRFPTPTPSTHARTHARMHARTHPPDGAARGNDNGAVMPVAEHATDGRGSGLEGGGRRRRGLCDWPALEAAPMPGPGLALHIPGLHIEPQPAPCTAPCIRWPIVPKRPPRHSLPTHTRAPRPCLHHRSTHRQRAQLRQRGVQAAPHKHVERGKDALVRACLWSSRGGGGVRRGRWGPSVGPWGAPNPKPMDSRPRPGQGVDPHKRRDPLRRGNCVLMHAAVPGAAHCINVASGAYARRWRPGS